MAEPESRDNALHAASLVLILLGLLVGFGLLPRLFTAREPALVGKDAPDFSARIVVNGEAGAQALALRELRGKAVVLDFWATWCGPCRAEAPVVNKVAQRFKDRDVVVVGVNTSDDEGKARRWALSHGLSFPIVYDEDNATANAYGVDALPTLVVVSRTGKVVAVRTGPTDDAELESLLRLAL